MIDIFNIGEYEGTNTLSPELSLRYNYTRQEVDKIHKSAILSAQASDWGNYYQTEFDSDKMEAFMSDKLKSGNEEEFKQLSSDIAGAIPAFSTELNSVDMGPEYTQGLLEQTAIHESGGLEYDTQIGGPARSYFQVEPNTVKDIAKNAPGILGGKFTEYTGVSAGDLKNMSTSEIEELLLTNQKFAASMAIVTYYRNQKKKKE